MAKRLLPSGAGLACVLALAGSALSACSGSSVSATLDPVAEAAGVSELAPGFKASLYEEITPAGQSQVVTGSGSGVFDQRLHRGLISMVIHGAGQTVTAESGYSDQAIYMRLPGTSNFPLAKGRSWVSFSLTGVDSALGINASALTDPSGSSDPSQFLSYLKGTRGQPTTAVGSETVQGVSTTRYRSTINYDDYAAGVPPAQRAAARQSVAALERLLGTHTQAVEVWVDAQHRIRREELGYQECLPGSSGPLKLHLRIEYSDFAVQVMPAFPTPAETTDLTAYIVEELKHVKLGCG